MNNFEKLNWVNSTGGPLIFIDLELAATWRGIYGLSASSDSASDYERACSVSEYVSTLTVGNGKALILGDEPSQSTAIQLREDQALLIRWIWADNEQSIIDSIPVALGRSGWKSVGLEVAFPSGTVVLFDASSEKIEPRNSLTVQLRSGIYNVDTLEFESGSSLRLLMHRIYGSRRAC